MRSRHAVLELRLDRRRRAASEALEPGMHAILWPRCSEKAFLGAAGFPRVCGGDFPGGVLAAKRRYRPAGLGSVMLTELSNGK